MTETKTAGYFDQKRSCPMYEGDVYVLPFEEPKFFKIVKYDIANFGTSGFKVVQVGTANEFSLSEIGKRFVEEGEFIGNEKENPHTIDDYIKAEVANKEAAESVVEDEQPAPAVQEILDKVEEDAVVSAAATTGNLPVEEAINTVEQAINTVEQANEELKESNEELKEAIETMFDAPSEEKEMKDEQICSPNSDGTDAELQNTTDEGSTVSAGTEPEGNEPAEPAEEKTDDKPNLPAETTKSNVIVEEATPATKIEVIANTADEKQALLRVKLLEKHITENSAEIVALQEKVEYHKDLASTLDYEPFIKLKNLVSEALHTNVDDENIKGIKDRTKDFESIVNIQNLLKEHQRLASKYEQDIADLEDEISKFETEKAELNEKINTFAAQTKLPLTDAE